MTMQVGMVGTDGVLIASDTKYHVAPSVPADKFWLGGRHSFHATKIHVSYERGIAVSSALSMETADHVASEVITGLADQDFASPIAPIEALGLKVLAAARIDRREASCLIALAHPTPELLLFVFWSL